MEYRTFCIDGDTLRILFRYDEGWQVWLGEYPYFEEEPRYTPTGRPWKNVTNTRCPYAAGVYDDCGTCPNLTKQSPSDLIGVCFNDQLKQPCAVGKRKKISP